MNRFWFSHGNEGTQVYLEDMPLWAHVLEQTGEWIAEKVFPGHKLCCEIPEWAFELGWGKWDPEFKCWEHSLGRVTWQFSTWVETGFGAYKKAKWKGHLPVTYEWVQEHFPDLGSPFTDGFQSDDAMESSANDSGDVVL